MKKEIDNLFEFFDACGFQPKKAEKRFIIRHLVSLLMTSRESEESLDWLHDFINSDKSWEKI